MITSRRRAHGATRTRWARRGYTVAELVATLTLLGLVGTAGKSFQYRLFTVSEWQHAAYFRDRWTVSPKLTLDLGLPGQWQRLSWGPS